MMNKENMIIFIIRFICTNEPFINLSYFPLFSKEFETHMITFKINESRQLVWFRIYKHTNIFVYNNNLKHVN